MLHLYPDVQDVSEISQPLCHDGHDAGIPRRSPIQVSRADPASLSRPSEIELAWAIQLRADKLNYADWIWETHV